MVSLLTIALLASTKANKISSINKSIINTALIIPFRHNNIIDLINRPLLRPVWFIQNMFLPVAHFTFPHGDVAH